MPGVVSLPEGARAEFDAGRVDMAGSANMLTATDGAAPGAACIMHEITLEVRRGDQAPRALHDR